MMKLAKIASVFFLKPDRKLPHQRLTRRQFELSLQSIPNHFPIISQSLTHPVETTIVDIKLPVPGP